MRISVYDKIFKLFKKSWRNYLGPKNVSFCLLSLNPVNTLFYWIFSVKNYFPVFTRKSLNIIFLSLGYYSSLSSLIHFSDPKLSGIFSLTGYDLFNLNPFVLISPCFELNVSYLIKSRIIEIVFELHIDVLSVFRILRIWETIRLDKYPVHEWLRNSLIRHYTLFYKLKIFFTL